MILVSVAFIVCCFPISFYFIVVDNTAQTSSDMFASFHIFVKLEIWCIG